MLTHQRYRISTLWWKYNVFWSFYAAKQRVLGLTLFVAAVGFYTELEGLGFVKPKGLGSMRDPSSCCAVPLAPEFLGTSICVHWNGFLAPARCQVNCMPGCLKAVRLLLLIFVATTDVVKVRGKVIRPLQMTSVFCATMHVCQLSSCYSAENFPSQLTAGGEEPFNNMSCNERLRSREPSTNTPTHTHTQSIRLLKQDMTHASFPYASQWQVIRPSHNSCSAGVVEAHI